MGATSWDTLNQMAEKYRHLVWYARHQSRRVDPQRWMKIQNEIKHDALRAARDVEGNFPAETEALTNLSTADWSHGFNSGVLAGIRFVMTCTERTILPSQSDNPDDFGDKITVGGLDEALAEFPDLDT